MGKTLQSNDIAIGHGSSAGAAIAVPGATHPASATPVDAITSIAIRRTHPAAATSPIAPLLTASAIAYLRDAARSADMADSCGPQVPQSCWPPKGRSKCPLLAPTCR